MPDPTTIALGVQAGLGALSAIDKFRKSRQKEKLFQEVLAERRKSLDRLRRTARGELTSSELAALRAGNAPARRQVASSLASRGIGTDPVAARPIAEVEQRPILAAQQAAQAALPQAEGLFAQTMLGIFQQDTGLADSASELSGLLGQLGGSTDANGIVIDEDLGDIENFIDILTDPQMDEIAGGSQMLTA